MCRGSAGHGIGLPLVLGSLVATWIAAFWLRTSWTTIAAGSLTGIFVFLANWRGQRSIAWVSLVGWLLIGITMSEWSFARHQFIPFLFLTTGKPVPVTRRNSCLSHTCENREPPSNVARCSLRTCLKPTRHGTRSRPPSAGRTCSRRPSETLAWCGARRSPASAPANADRHEEPAGKVQA